MAQLNITLNQDEILQLLFDDRGEAALVAALAEMVVNGISTRKVSRIVEEL